MALNELPFQNIRESALRQIRLGEAPAAARRQQNINVAGVRTSGVGQLPLIEAARNRSLAETGVENQISGLEAQQIGAERLAQLQSELDINKARELSNLGLSEDQTLGRRGFQSEILGGAIGLGGGALKSALIAKFPWLAAAQAVTTPKKAAV